MNDPKPPRAGEVMLDHDPGAIRDATLAFIGVLNTDWSDSAPRNLRQAREAGGGGGVVTLDPAYAPGLRGLSEGQAVWLVLWFDRSRRDLIVQAPRHADGPRGTFALRSPVRPNPIAIEAVRITGIDHAAGRFTVDATDAMDGTPVLDIKPWLDRIDIPPEGAGEVG